MGRRQKGRGGGGGGGGGALAPEFIDKDGSLPINKAIVSWSFLLLALQSPSDFALVLRAPSLLPSVTGAVGGVLGAVPHYETNNNNGEGGEEAMAAVASDDHTPRHVSAAMLATAGTVNNWARAAHSLPGGVTRLVTRTPVGVIHWCLRPYSLRGGCRSLPGVRLVTRTILGVVIRQLVF
jgi:hypothetical protein